ncbi:MAG: patatin-like phospholipase family protein [Parahaliea sp.]
MSDPHPTSPRIVPIIAGGGARLPAHIGILAALRDRNIPFDRLVGVSGGSIVSSLYCAGMPLPQMQQLALDTNFRHFTRGSVLRLLRNGGMNSGDEFERWMDHLLDGKCFADLDTTLHIVATDVNGGGPVIFDRDSTPEMKISEAVRYSMSIPLIFSFKHYRDYILVDGAILSEDALFRDWAGDGTPSLCFRLQSDNQTTLTPGSTLIPLKTYISLLMRTFMTSLSREYVNASYWYRTIIVKTGSVSSVDFDLTPDQKNHLYQLGYDTASVFVPRKLESYLRERGGTANS